MKKRKIRLSAILLFLVMIILIPTTLSIYRETKTKTLGINLTHPNYNLTLDADGGTIPTTSGYTNSQDNKTATKVVTYGHEYGTLPTPVKEGYTFKGWNGKNLFDEENWLMSIPGATKENGYYVFNPKSAFVLYGATPDDGYIGSSNIDIDFKQNTSYTIRITGYTELSEAEGIHQVFFIGFVYTDGTMNRLSLGGSSEVERTYTSETGKTIDRVYMVYGRNQGNAHIKNLQIEEGTTATTYEPYYITSSTNVTQAKNHSLTAKYTPNKYTVEYDYNITNYTFNNSEYIDTGYIFDWNKDFTLTSTINIPKIGERYLLFGNYSGRSKDLSLEINTVNQLMVWFEGAQKSVSNGTVSAGEDINITFTWVASTHTYTLTSTGPNSNATATGTYNVTGSATRTLRIGTTDYRGPSEFSPYTLKSVKMSKTNYYDNNLDDMPTNITKTGYTFTGWNTEANGSGTAYLDGVLVNNLTTTNNGTVTLYAQWIANTYTVTLDADGGTIPTTSGWTNAQDNKTATKTVTYGSPYGTLPEPSKTGYQFAGWNSVTNTLPNGYMQVEYIESNGTQYIDTGYYWQHENVEMYFDGMVLTNDSNQSLFGDEEYIESTGTSRYFSGIPYGTNGAFTIYIGSGPFGGLKVNLGRRFTLDIKTTLNNDLLVKLNDVVKIDRTYNGSVQTRSVAYTSSNISTNVGNIFLFANHNTSRGTTDSSIQNIGSMRVYTFKLYDNDLLVRDFVPCVQTSTGKAGLYDKVNNVFYGNSATTGDDFTVGYITSSSIVNIPNNHTLTAVYTPNTYSIVFDKNDNDATGTMNNQTFNYDTAQNLTTNVYTKTGYTFTGWNTRADGQGTAYLDGVSVNNLTTTNNETVTLYAQWIANTYTVTFNNNIFNSNTFEKDGLFIDYDFDTSILTLNGNSTSSTNRIELFDFPTTFVEGEQYKLDVKYLSGTTTISNDGILTLAADVFNSSNNQVSQRNCIDVQLGKTYNTTNTRQINSSSESEGVKFNYHIYFSTGASSYTFNNYKVKVNFTKVESKQVTYDSAYGTLPEPTRTGYTFGGWNGKNLFNSSDWRINSSGGLWGLNGDISSDGVVHLYGTPSISDIGIFRLAKYKYGLFSGGNIVKYNYTSINNASIESNGYNEYDDSTWLLEELKMNGESYVDISFKIMISNDISTTYEPYYITSSTNVTQAKNHTLTAKWQKKEATFDTGENFNVKIKKLANPSETISDSLFKDANITRIQRTNVVPQSWIGQNGTITPPSNDNIVSTSTSPYPIYAWYDSGILYYYTESLNPYMNDNANNMFRGLTNVEHIDINTIDTSKMMVARYLLVGDSKLSTIDLSNFNTSSMIEMSGMFEQTSLTSLNLSSFDTSNVINMQFMFSQSIKLKSITFGNNFDTSKVTNMQYMFSACFDLENLDLSNFDMNKVTNATNMLSNMTSLQSLKTPNVYPSNKTITLPKMMIDSNGNEYTTLDSTSPTSTWLYTPATFLPGTEFNTKIKNLAGDTLDSTYPYLTVDANITSIERANYLPMGFTPTSANTVSTNDSQYPIYAWFDNGIIYYYSEATNLYMNSNSNYMFISLQNVKTINISSVNSSKVTQMGFLFESCKKLENLIHNLDTSNVRNMYGMFGACEKLTSINLSSFNTSNVENMQNVFYGCSSLTELDLSTFDMSNVINTSYMFHNVTSLTSLKTPNTYPTDTSVTITLPKTMYDSSGNEYTTLTSTSPTSTWLYTPSTFISGDDFVIKVKELSNPNNDNVRVDTADTNITAIARANALPNNFVSSTANTVSTSDSGFPINIWIDNGTLYYYTESPKVYLNSSAANMFRDFINLTSIDISTIDTSKTTSMYALFDNDPSLTSINLNNFDTSLVTDMAFMFRYCTSLTSINLSGFDTSSLVSISDMFYATTLTSIDMSSFDLSSLLYASDVFTNNTALKAIKTPTVNPTNTTISLPLTLYDNNGTAYTDITSSSPTNTWLTTLTMFTTGADFNIKIKQLANPNVVNINVDTVDNNITSISRANSLPANFEANPDNTVSTSDSYNDIYIWYENGAIYYYSVSSNIFMNQAGTYMFKDLRSVTSIDITTINTKFETDAQWQFAYDHALTTLDLTHYDGSSLVNFALMDMFYECSSLTTLDLSNFNNTTSINTSDELFLGCTSLVTLDISGLNLGGVITGTNMFANLTSLANLKTPSAMPPVNPIYLPVTLYDQNGTAYTEFNSSTPTNTWLRLSYAP